MAAKAQEISMEAGSKMAAAMKDVVSAAAGLSAFAIESARDLVQYMVRRGQMTQDEADRLIREVEEAQSKRRSRAHPPAKTAKPAAKKPSSARAAKPAPKKATAKKPAAKKRAGKPKKPSRPAAKARRR